MCNYISSWRVCGQQAWINLAAFNVALLKTIKIVCFTYIVFQWLLLRLQIFLYRHTNSVPPECLMCVMLNQVTWSVLKMWGWLSSFCLCILSIFQGYKPVQDWCQITALPSIRTSRRRSAPAPRWWPCTSPAQTSARPPVCQPGYKISNC